VYPRTWNPERRTEPGTQNVELGTLTTLPLPTYKPLHSSSEASSHS